jgi:hypothetical protein
MRAKMKLNSVDRTHEGKDGDSYRSIAIRMSAVSKADAYPPDGSDENNSFARWSPSADLSMTIANPSLFDKLKEGATFYVDFSEAPA